MLLKRKVRRKYASSVCRRNTEEMLRERKTATVRERFRDRCIRLPMVSQARSLNLANSAAVLIYEALRQNGFPGLLGTGEMRSGGV